MYLGKTNTLCITLKETSRKEIRGYEYNRSVDFLFGEFSVGSVHLPQSH